MAISKCHQATSKGHRPHQSDMLPLLILVAAMRKGKQINESS